MLIRLWKSFPGFKHQSAFSTWLYRVALNTAIDIIRKESLQPIYLELSKIEYLIPDNKNNIESVNQDRQDCVTFLVEGINTGTRPKRRYIS